MTSIGSHKRKRGWLAVVAGAAVLATGTGMTVASSVSASPVSAAPAGASVRMASTAGAAHVVAPGERIAVAGNQLWLTAKGLHVVAPKSSGTDKPDVIRVADVLPGKVRTIARGDASGVLFAGIYRGPVTATTKVTVKLGARTLQAKVATLAGKPGWGAYYVFDAEADASVKPSIIVQS
ncbi:hypothetical protein [Streptomyces xantholiticus]|uniref:hypothetical protein n=1 Tax=Streptomyces xantholiticus TaxID=68285 RepID=UPI001672CE42|nr:hypothetical protein [Streptomyces xantholiticus]GGW68921.1 hypothetical protein GCM10010381_62320 [Streptomyces xantholiticus]